jgi:hypothetical protein
VIWLYAFVVIAAVVFLLALGIGLAHAASRDQDWHY